VNALFGYNRYEFPKKSHNFVKNMVEPGKILGFGDFTKTVDNMTCMKGIPRLYNINAVASILLFTFVL
jgi:hypothetical protein